VRTGAEGTSCVIYLVMDNVGINSLLPVGNPEEEYREEGTSILLLICNHHHRVGNWGIDVAGTYCCLVSTGKWERPAEPEEGDCTAIVTRGARTKSGGENGRPP
jgi:hypothetical protein